MTLHDAGGNDRQRQNGVRVGKSRGCKQWRNNDANATAPAAPAARPPGGCARRLAAALALTLSIGTPLAALPAQASPHAASAVAAEVAELASLRTWLAARLNAESVQLVPVGHGHHSHGSYVVHHADGRAFYKRVPPEHGVDFAEVAANNQEAAELGFGPPVLAIDWQRGAMLLGYVDGEHGDDDPATVARLRRPLLHTLRQLHAATATGTELESDAAEAHASCDALHAAAVAAAAAPPELVAAAAVACHATTEVLGRLPRPRVRTHNDLNPRNMVWAGNVVHLVDWDTLGWGDPLQDVALYALEHSLGGAALPALLSDYQGDTEGLVRLQLYLARLHARRVLTLAVGMPWDEAGLRLRQLANYATLLAEDEAVLGPLG